MHYKLALGNLVKFAFLTLPLLKTVSHAPAISNLSYCIANIGEVGRMRGQVTHRGGSMPRCSTTCHPGDTLHSASRVSRVSIMQKRLKHVHLQSSIGATYHHISIDRVRHSTSPSCYHYWPPSLSIVSAAYNWPAVHGTRWLEHRGRTRSIRSLRLPSLSQSRRLSTVHRVQQNSSTCRHRRGEYAPQTLNVIASWWRVRETQSLTLPYQPGRCITLISGFLSPLPSFFHLPVTLPSFPDYVLPHRPPSSNLAN